MQIAQSDELVHELDLNIRKFGENEFNDRLENNFMFFLSGKKNNFEQRFLKRNLFFRLSNYFERFHSF